MRAALRRELLHTLAELDPRRLPSDSPLRRPAARANEHLLRGIADRVGNSAPISARGLLLGRDLIQDGSSPLTRPQCARRTRAMTEVVAPHRALPPARRRAADADGAARGDAAPEDSRPADLRVRPAVVRRVRDGVRARRARRRGRLSALHLVLPISLAIAALPAIVVVSYMQTVNAYETSGGAYIVARENLGTLPSLVGAAALHTDYVLTVAVSISAGIFAITSFAPSLGPHKVALSLACLGLIVLANLRGVRESGLIFALPTYLVVLSIAALVAGGIAELAMGNLHHAVTPNPLPVGTGRSHALRSCCARSRPVRRL